jgi:gas vesicle protein
MICKNERLIFVKYIIGVIAGGIVGFLYYELVGCPTGACPITSNPYSSTIYGAILGGLIGASF